MTPPIFRIHWVDSQQHNGWAPLDAAIETAKRTMDCETVGYLIQVWSDRIVLAQSLSYSGDGGVENVSELMTIPRVAVTKVVRL